MPASGVRAGGGTWRAAYLFVELADVVVCAVLGVHEGRVLLESLRGGHLVVRGGAVRTSSGAENQHERRREQRRELPCRRTNDS